MRFVRFVVNGSLPLGNMWHCTSDVLFHGRPDVPDDDFQTRLGWPTRRCDAYDGSVLQHLARVRANVRETMNRTKVGCGVLQGLALR